MLKKLFKMLAIFLVAVMIFPTSAFAAESKNHIEQVEDEAISLQTEEVLGKLSYSLHSIAKTPKYTDFSSDKDIVNFIKYGPKTFSSGVNMITAEEILKQSQNVTTNATGDVTGTFTSARLDTGTPGVTWDYTVNYTIAPMPGGIGWYFKSVNCTVKAYKGFLFYTWATSGLISFTSATHTLSPTTRPTSLTINVTMNFEIWTQATGASPVTYSESHSHTTEISNVYE